MKKAFTKIMAVVILLCVCIPAVCVHAVSAGEQPELRYFGKEMLSGDELYIYELFEGNLTDINNLKGEIKIDRERGISADTVSRVLSVFIGDHPECFYLSNQISYSAIDGDVISIKNGYYAEGESLISMNEALEGVVTELLSAMERDLDSPNDYEKALYLHDAVAAITEYQKVGLHQTAVGALVYGRAVCAGYASAYQLLLNRAGISAFTVTGNSIEPTTKVPEPHAWTLMEIDGRCVYADVTWDDQGDSLYHAYFGMSRAEIEKTHFTDEMYALPICSHSDMSYADKKGFVFTDADGAEVFASEVKRINETACIIDLFYEGEDLSAWLENNMLEVYGLLGGSGSLTYSTAFIENEYHIEITGDFSGSSLPDTPIAPPAELPTADTSIEVPDGDVVFGEDETEQSTEASGEGTLPDDSSGGGGKPSNKPSGAQNGTAGGAISNPFGCNSTIGAGICIIAALAGLVTVMKKRK